MPDHTGTTTPGRKSEITYHLSQAILALGKDDMSRVWSNVNKATAILQDYEAERSVRRIDVESIVHKPEPSR